MEELEQNRQLPLVKGAGLIGGRHTSTAHQYMFWLRRIPTREQRAGATCRSLGVGRIEAGNLLGQRCYPSPYCVKNVSSVSRPSERSERRARIQGRQIANFAHLPWVPALAPATTSLRPGHARSVA